MCQYQAMTTSKMVMWWVLEGVNMGEYTKGFWELSCGKTEKQLVSQRQVIGSQFRTILVMVGNSCGLISLALHAN